MNIIQFPNSILRAKSTDVSSIMGEGKRVVEELLTTIKENDNGVGLSAPQLGILRRVFVALNDDLTELQPFINPKILEYSEEKTVHREGCLSIPDIFALVTRPERIRLAWYTPDSFEGTHHEEWFDGYKARVIQHEIDHLNGTLFIDRINETEKLRIRDKIQSVQKRAARNTQNGRKRKRMKKH